MADIEQHSGMAEAAPWIAPLKKALNHGGTRRPKRDRQEAKRKQVQLGSVDPETLRPSVRTVAFRGFLPAQLAEGDPSLKQNEESCLLTFVTDSRASKVRHVRGGAEHVECCWWLDEAGVQFRIAGRAVLAAIDDEEPSLRAAAVAVWERLSDSTKNTFTWPDPGAPRVMTASGEAASAASGTDAECKAGDLHDARDAWAELAIASESTTGVAANPQFSLFVVIPDRVDELRLGGHQRRFVYTRHDGEDKSGLPRSPLSLPPGTWWEVEEVNP